MSPKKEELVQRSRRAFTRMARFIDQMMRGQLTSSPITVQQCYTLEALMDGPKPMNELAGEVALHQSTLSRIVEKLEKQGHVTRTRPADNQRKVEVCITEKGRAMYAFLDAQCNQMISELLDMIPAKKRKALLESLEEISLLLDPQNSAFQRLLSRCCCGQPGGTCQLLDKIE
jgi:DNA-binding MarR family transcriptional regulator